MTPLEFMDIVRPTFTYLDQTRSRLYVRIPDMVLVLVQDYLSEARLEFFPGYLVDARKWRDVMLPATRVDGQSEDVIDLLQLISATLSGA